MKYHNIKIRGRTCSCDDKRLVQGTVGQDAVTLDLDEEWNGLEVTVTFVSSKGPYTPAGQDGIWPVPWEVLAEDGEVTVGIEGRRGTDVLKTVRPEWALRVRPSISSPGQLPSDPTVSDLQALVLEAKELKAQIAQTVADARAVLGEIEGYGIAEWSVDAGAHRLLVGPIKSRKDDA